MIIVLGTAVAFPQHFEQALAISTEHVLRSRAEPGCISHAVHRGTENPNQLEFVERWASMDALKAHFVVPESRAFARAIGGLCAERPTMSVYDANELKIG